MSRSSILIYSSFLNNARQHSSTFSCNNSTSVFPLIIGNINVKSSGMYPNNAHYLTVFIMSLNLRVYPSSSIRFLVKCRTCTDCPLSNNLFLQSSSQHPIPVSLLSPCCSNGVTLFTNSISSLLWNRITTLSSCLISSFAKQLSVKNMLYNLSPYNWTSTPYLIASLSIARL